MASVLVRDLPDEVHRELVRRAAASGQSLQHYLAGQLTQLVETPTLEDVLQRIESRSGGRVGAEAVTDLADERSAR